jgi:hypothetical protein
MPLFETGTTYVAGLAPEREILISFLLLKFCNLFLLLVDPYQYNVHLPYFPLFFFLSKRFIIYKLALVINIQDSSITVHLTLNNNKSKIQQIRLLPFV